MKYSNFFLTTFQKLQKPTNAQEKGLMSGGGKNLRGCPPKNRPLTSDQNFDFLQNFSTKQDLYKVKENTFLWFLFLIIVEILIRMWSIPETLKLDLSRSRN